MKQAGLAKTQFFESFQRRPWNPSKTTLAMSKDNWPLLTHYLNQKKISYFDYLLTQRLARHLPQTSQEAALFICHLILATKAGNLCVKIKGDEIFPKVDLLWKNETDLPLTDQETEVLSQSIQKGSQSVPLPLITQVSTNLTPIHSVSNPICQLDHCFYLQRYWIYESLFLQYLHKHLQSTPSFSMNSLDLQMQLQLMSLKGELNEKQAQAIEQALNQPLSLITGGPGTGKTYTAGKLIRTFWQLLSPAERSNCQIVLAAPTGKAAANLQKSLGKAVSDLAHFPPLQAKTLHALLNLKQLNATTRLNADLILIDESSMIGIELMSHLLKALKKGARLILLGDPHQLPSVDAGSAFIDLSHISQTIPSTQLDVCLRTELKTLVDFAQLIKNGLADEALAFLNQTSSGISRLHFSESVKEAQKELVTYAAKFFPTFIQEKEQVTTIFPLFNSMRLLSPVRKGLFGVDVLNQLIWQKITQNALDQGWLAIPIMIATNDYQQDLFNGETGLLLRKLPLKNSSAEDFAVFAHRNHASQMRQIASVLLPKYELAYCLSVHKSQGSEFDRIVLALPEGAEAFGREVFYTAVTRARKQIEIYGSDLTIKKTIMQQARRLSGIGERFNAHL